MELFNKVEHGPPNVVLIESGLCATDEFELIVTLFDALDVRWLKFTRSDRPNDRHDHASELSKNGGLFSISLAQEDCLLIGQVLSTANATQRAERPVERMVAAPTRRFKRVVLIGSSTGGVDALKNVLSKFDADCPPTVVVQHTSQGFGGGLTRVLGRASAAQIKPFEPDAPLRSGTIYVVAGLPQHVILNPSNRPFLRTCPDPPMSGHLPSIDKLFLSCIPFADRVVGCILTGMGTDGVRGLLELRKAGARTLSQDRESSVVYGMPGAAWSMGASMQQVPLKAMGDTILREATL